LFLDDAEQKTESWKLRHSPEARATLGVWRWKGMQRYMDTILGLCIGKRVIDFGGFDGPLGLGSIVVDPKAECKTLDDVPGQVDVIFTSHTLEHCADLEGTLRAFYDKLIVGGHVIVHVPAWTCKRWRAGEYDNPAQAEVHKWTFQVSADHTDAGAAGYVPIEWMVGLTRTGKLFTVIDARHCGDNSIMVIGEKRG
jgi:hypothetical protein